MKENEVKTLAPVSSETEKSRREWKCLDAAINEILTLADFQVISKNRLNCPFN